jgi:CheY-like chemotaxis protein
MAKKCLIVDDVEVSRFASKIALAEIGVESDEAANASTCMEAVNRTHYDVILLDWHLRRDNGLELIGRIHATSGNGNVPVIVCSGVAEPDAIQQAKSAGAVSFYEKPMTAEKLRVEFKNLGLI